MKAFNDFQIDILGGLVPGILFLIGLVANIFPLAYNIYCYSLGDGNHYVITPSSFSKLLISIQNTPSTIWFFTFLGLGIFTYVVGHLFYRRDPKEVDKSSFGYLIKRDSIEYANNIAQEQIDKAQKTDNLKIRFPHLVILLHGLFGRSPLGLNFIIVMLYKIVIGFKTFASIIGKRLSENFYDNYGASKISECEFPYPKMKNYLDKRKLFHLTPIFADLVTVI